MPSGPATPSRFNAEREFERNQERYAFLRWGQGAFEHFAVVPPDTGIVHQVNLEYLARVVFDGAESGCPGGLGDGRPSQLYPDTLVGTDSHTTMVNGLGVLGWGVGGIEAEAAMLGQPMSMLIPQVLGFELHGELPAGATATDLVLTVTEMLRERGVVGMFVEFHGAGLAALPIADRATIGNMSPEFGSTCAIFPIDAETLRYLEFSGRPAAQIELVEAYAREQGLWHDERVGGAGLLGQARARPRRGRAEPRRAQAPAGPGRAERGARALPGGAGVRICRDERRARAASPAGRGLLAVVSRERPARRRRAGQRRRGARPPSRTSRREPPAAAAAATGRRRTAQSR